MNHSEKILVELGKYMIFLHAPICEDPDCWCRASVFLDNLALLKKVNQTDYKQIANEIFNRDQKK